MARAKKTKYLGSSESHHVALMRNLARSLMEHEGITTTQAKAAQVQPFAEKIITLAKRGDRHARRQVLEDIADRELVHKIFAEFGPRYAERAGGYTRIYRLGPRQGDAAPMARIELV